MSSYRKLKFYGRAANFHFWSNNGRTNWGFMVCYVSNDVGNVTLYHSEFVVPGTLDLND